MTSFTSWLSEALANDPTASARALKSWLDTNKGQQFWHLDSEDELAKAFETPDKLASEMQANVNTPNEKILDILKEYEARKGFAMHWFNVIQGLKDIVSVGDTIDSAVVELAKMLQATEFIEWQEDENQPKESIFKTQMSKDELMDIYLKNKKDDGTSKIVLSCSMAGKMRIKFKDGKIVSVKIK